MDIVRCIYYKVMTRTGFADTYRYEQYISKPDRLYELEALFISANLNSKDKKKVKENVSFILLFSFCFLIDIVPARQFT